jgi:phosphate transport system substrate-binding protein
MGDLTGPGRGRVLALDAIVPVVAPGNPVREITMPDLARVFAGEIVNWADLGGPDAPITLYFPSEESGLAQAAQDYLLHPANRTLAETAQRAAPDGTLVRRVAEDPFGIGIAGYSGTGTAQALTLAGDCGFRLAASPWTIKTEDYPLTSPMFMYLPARRLPKIGREFLAYLRSPTAQVVVRRAGFVDQAAERIGLDVQGDRFANAILAAGPEVPLDELHRMTAFLRPMTRLTLSFRFETGASRPDAQSRSNLALLAETIESGAFDGRRLVFVGFSDGEGPAPANQRIALARAEAVRNAVMSAAQAAGAGQVEIGVEAFGEALPMACDNSDWGRKVNRRVEVWVE